MKTKENNPTGPGSPTPCKQALSLFFIFPIHNFLSPLFTFLLFYHNFVVLLPQKYRYVILRVFCSFFNTPFSLSTIVSFFSHNYVVLFTIVVITQCSCSFPKNSIVFVQNVFFLLPQSYCSFPKIVLSFFTMLLSQFYWLILLLHCYFFIIPILFFFHNSFLAERRFIKFCRNSHRAWNGRRSIGDQGNLALHVTDVLAQVVLCWSVRKTSGKLLTPLTVTDFVFGPQKVGCYFLNIGVRGSRIVWKVDRDKIAVKSRVGTGERPGILVLSL